MWTPKRVGLLFGGFALLLTVYTVYSQFLGGIDGLTPLPEIFWPSEGPVAELPLLGPAVNVADHKLQQAFGPDCDELKRTIKLDLRNRGLVLAIDEFEPEPDGRVRLKPFNLAMFGKSVSATGMPEINTIKSDVAYLTFDQPVKNVAELNNRKIKEAELRGNIGISNNRRTPARDDDMVLTMSKGPMYFKEELHRIWTDDIVTIEDGGMRSKDQPSKVTAEGMDVYLTTDNGQAPPAQKAGHKAKSKVENISGVDRVVFRSSVQMNLYVDAGSGFLTSGKQAEKPAVAQAPPAAAADKAEVVINTHGPFTYDVTQDKAIFDIPHRNSTYSECVEVTRKHQQAKFYDDLKCDHLELQFTRKAPAASHKAPSATPATPANENRPEGLTIESAHATGQRVTLDSQAEGLNATGNDLFYDAATQLSILKGKPEMIAMKDGNEIHARELRLTNGTKGDKKNAQATAIGPGYVGMLDRTADGMAAARTLQARWKDTLTYQKEGELDCLTLTGDAAFVDELHGQQLRADRLKLWLEPAPAGTAAPSPEPTSQQQRLRPNHLEAKGRVTADSPEMHVKEPTQELIIWFKDIPASKQLPGTNQETSALQPPTAGARNEGKAPRSLELPASVPLAAVAENPKPALGLLGGQPGNKTDKPKKPIDLVARLVKVYVLRNGSKNDLDRLWCEGAVHVHQDPGSADERGVDIRGETLDLNHSPEGSVLVVNGKWAQVQIEKIAILGPEVNIDQRANKAWVTGVGAMQMLNATNFEGKKLTQPTELTVHWKESMLFNGKNADFNGGVQAEQENSRLLCQSMQVVFDQPISLKEGNKHGGPQPRVSTILCDQNVQIEDVTRQDAYVVGYKRLVAPEVSLDNEDSVVTAPGPGEVRLFQLGTAEDPIGSPRTAPAAKAGPKPKSQAKQEFKLTHVRFLERMQANNKRRTAIFYGKVEVVHVPTDKPDLTVDLDHPPQGCVYLRCEKLSVFSTHLADGRTTQEMIAEKKVVVQAQEFWGFADVVKYDEIQERVIFEAGEGNVATLYRVKTAGSTPEKITGRKIIYWRSTGDFRVEDGGTINIAN